MEDEQTPELFRAKLKDYFRCAFTLGGNGELG
jgi:hypothetical protein